MRVKNFILTLSLLCVLSVPAIVAAAETSLSELVSSTANAAAGLVTCNGPDCTFCSLMQMIDKIIDWLVGFSMIIATIGIAIAGYRLVFSQGSSGAVTKTKELFTSIVIGIILIMTAWLLIDTVMKLLVGEEFGPWNQIEECGGMFGAGTPAEQTVTATDHENTLDLNVADYVSEVEIVGNGGANLNYAGTSVTPVPVSGMVSLRAAGVEVANWYGTTGPGRTDLAHPTVVAAVKRMQDLAVQRYGKRIFQVSAAYTNGVGHSSGSKHYVGIAVDFDEINGGTLSQIEVLAREVGFSYVLNEGNHIHGDMRSKVTAQ